MGSRATFGDWPRGVGERSTALQRLTGDVVQPFSDAAPSLPVPFTSGTWGSLASLGARTYPGTRRRYGTSGNTFIAVVEFGDSVRARAISPGGESGDPRSPHFNDQMLSVYARRSADGCTSIRLSSVGTRRGGTGRGIALPYLVRLT
jgi:acyl-homoserine lactone acylase PvdQ